MSVMAETTQSAMGPYAALAAVGSALNSWTAVTREALVVKVAPPGQVPGPHLEPYPAEAKAAVPAHAQRMSHLLASDKEFACCRVAWRAYGAGRRAGWGAGGGGLDSRARSVQGRRLDCRFGAGRGEERTSNM